MGAKCETRPQAPRLRDVCLGHDIGFVMCGRALLLLFEQCAIGNDNLSRELVIEINVWGFLILTFTTFRLTVIFLWKEFNLSMKSKVNQT